MTRVRKIIGQIHWWLISVPIPVKILGIGVLVAVVFGSVTLYQIRRSLAYNLEGSLRASSLATANSFAVRLERMELIGDQFGMNRLLSQSLEADTNIAYILVYDAEGQVVAHTFGGSVPSRLVVLSDRANKGYTTAHSGSRGDVVEATVPILAGQAGWVRLGLKRAQLHRQVAGVTESVLYALGFCVIVGLGMAVGLTRLIARPLQQLVEAANHIRDGKYSQRVSISGKDEVGRLGEAFNQMAAGLETHRQQLLDKEQARLGLLQKLITSQEDERRRISRELHDHLGQSLSAIAMTLRSTNPLDGAEDSTTTDVEQRLRDLVEDVRRMAWGLRPSILDDYGLDHALARLIETATEHSEIAFDHQLVKNDLAESRLPEPIEVVLYRVSQEAVNNVVRHSGANRGSLILYLNPEEVTLLIEDNGHGFRMVEVCDSGEAGCLGIVDMRERVELIGGRFFVESKPGQGTTIRVTIPRLKETP